MHCIPDDSLTMPTDSGRIHVAEGEVVVFRIVDGLDADLRETIRAGCREP